MIIFYCSPKSTEFLRQTSPNSTTVEDIPADMPMTELIPCTTVQGNHNLNTTSFHSPQEHWMWTVDILDIKQDKYFVIMDMQSHVSFAIKVTDQVSITNLFSKFEIHIKKRFKRVALGHQMMPEIIEECFDNYDYHAGPYAFYLQPYFQEYTHVNKMNSYIQSSIDDDIKIDTCLSSWNEENHLELNIPKQNIYYLYWLNHFLSDSDYHDFLEPKFQYENIHNISNIISFNDFKKIMNAYK